MEARDRRNKPVKNMRVRFDLAGDVNSIGGTFTTGDNVVYSDANGVATSAYVPGTRSSPTDGVTVRACWDYVDFASDPRSLPSRSLDDGDSRRRACVGDDRNQRPDRDRATPV